MEPMLFFVIATAVVIGVFLFSREAARQRELQRREEMRLRKETLMLKYRDPEVVSRIVGKTVWQGQTEEMLIDSLGPPSDVDYKVLKTKRKEVWKYGRTGQNRYHTRVTLENNLVVGWDIK